MFIEKHRIFSFLLGFVFLIIFYVFSVQVKKERFKQINFDTTIRIQDNIPVKMDEILEDLSFFVSPVMSVVFIGLLTLIAGADLKKKRIRIRAVFIPILFAGLVGVEIYGKDRVESPAPPYFMIKNPTTLFPKYHVQDQYSYPSGHAGRALFIGGVIYLLSWKYSYRKFGVAGMAISGIPIVAMVLIISIGKIHLGQHWLSDIIGGWIVALAFLSFMVGIWFDKTTQSYE